MSDREPKRKLIGPWRSLHAVIWLAGIYILASHDWWWPGILVLVAISAVYEGFLQRLTPGAFVEETPVEAPKPTEAIRTSPPTVMAPEPTQEHRLELLPQVCPNCNAPIRGHEVKWTGAQSANCPYCGTNLPMVKA
jgi:hypothetical protein